MATWGAGVFDNDRALDWLDELERAGEAAITVALELAAIQNLMVAEPEGSRGLAAGEIVAAAFGHPPAGFPGEATDWVRSYGWKVNAELADLAVDAVTRIRESSELKDLWEEGDASEWHAAVDDLLARLRAG